jgi:hypothetical protein
LTEVKGASQLKDIKVSKLTSHVVYSLCWDTVWRVKTSHDSVKFDKVSLCPISYKLPFHVSQILGCLCSQVCSQLHRISGSFLQHEKSKQAFPSTLRDVSIILRRSSGEHRLNWIPWRVSVWAEDAARQGPALHARRDSSAGISEASGE